MTPIEERFFDAVESDDVALVARMLDEMPELINARNTAEDSDDDPPIHKAESRQMVELLLSRGADVYESDSRGRTPLEATNSFEIAAALVEHGAEVNVREDWNSAPLHLQVANGRITALLLEHGADATARDDEGQVPLHRAAVEDHFSVFCYAREHSLRLSEVDDDTPVVREKWPEQLASARLLIAHGADVNAKDVYGQTPLHIAAQDGFRDLAELLIICGADVNVGDRRGNTPLHVAARHEHKYVMRLLLSSHAEVNAEDSEGKTPLDVALIQERDQVVDILLESGAETHSPVTGLFVAAASGSAREVGRVLTADPALVGARDCQDRTALFRAVRHGHAEVVELLLASGADVNAGDWDRETPLHLAAGNGLEEIAAILIGSGAEVDAVRRDRNTPLTLASRGGFSPVVKMLLQAGARPDGVTKSGWRVVPLREAAFWGHAEVVRLLLEAGASVRGRWLGRGDQNPLSNAVRSGRVDIARVLLDAGASANLRRSIGGVMRIAAMKRSVEMVGLLVDRGAHLNATMLRSGSTPLHAAAELNRAEIVEELIRLGAKLNPRTHTEYTMWLPNEDETLWHPHAQVLPGATPLGVAFIAGAREAAEVLRRYGAKT